MPRPTFAIDFGSKLAGTTVVVAGEIGSSKPLRFRASAKKQDADEMIASLLAQEDEADVFLDAPLSLPGVYRGLPGFDHYHYREGDRALNAMSPMFLGGLTARAMRLAAHAPHCTWHEAYPAALATHLGLPKDRYKKQREHLPEIIATLRDAIHARFDPEQATTWHHVDALLAWLVAERHARGEAVPHGDPAEGVILV